jgi:hypothetical protein
MAITKAAKIEAEIEKVKVKISEFQAKLKELELKKRDAEDADIVGIVRGMSIPLDELAVMLQAVKSGEALPVSTSGQIGQKSSVLDYKEGDSE